ncbi:hypothetical protein GHK86_14880, partial [Acidimicrobiaceae bacterium USS-CC1]|nr:hypothetical protein [Acidiferrimicrobium australe]
MAASVGLDRGTLRERWRPGRRTFGFGALACATAMAISACGSGSGAGTAASHTSGPAPVVKGTPVKGGVASYALPLGEDFSWMLPLQNEANYENYDGNVESGMWRPLFYAGGAGTTGINYGLSIGQKPVYSQGNTVVTVNMN